MARVGIIGGSGLDDPAILKEPKVKILNTPYGDPSSPVTCGEINKVQVAILARHGRKHTIYPSAVNYRANIWALKALDGCDDRRATVLYKGGVSPVQKLGM